LPDQTLPGHGPHEKTNLIQHIGIQDTNWISIPNLKHAARCAMLPKARNMEAQRAELLTTW
jgi:hypothetical protein